MSSQEQLKKPQAVTYGDVFPGIEDGDLALEAVTMEDASLMQCAETLAFGGTQKGGAASAMQAAAAKNLETGVLDKDAHTSVAEYGVTVSETSIPGAVADISYIGDQPVYVSAYPTPTDPAFTSLEAVTIGEALEAAAVGSDERPIDEIDARAIMSAEARATGTPTPFKGGVGATAQSAASWNVHHPDSETPTTLSDVLMDATINLPADKVVTHEDALKVYQAECRNSDESNGEMRAGGIAATLAAAADMNELNGLVGPAIGLTKQKQLETETPASANFEESVAPATSPIKDTKTRTAEQEGETLIKQD